MTKLVDEGALSNGNVPKCEPKSTSTPPAWFEFLLSPTLLKNHLLQTDCDPSPTDLIIQFFANLPPSNQSWNSSKKVRALKTMALQAASHVGWNLDLFERELSLGVQRLLLVELKTICQEPDVPDELARFANILFTRWYARSWITHRFAKWMHENNGTQVQAAINLNSNHGMSQAQQMASDTDNNELFNEHVPDINIDRFFAQSFYYRGEMPATQMPSEPAERRKLLRETRIHCPTVNCFDVTSTTHDWSKCRHLDDDQFLNGALYDLGRFYFFTENFSNARQCLELIIVDDSVRHRYQAIEDYLQSAIVLSTTTTEITNELPTSDQDRDERHRSINLHPSNAPMPDLDDCLDDDDANVRDQCLAYFDSLGETATDVCKTDKTSDTEEGEISEGEDDGFGVDDDLDIRFQNHQTTSVPGVLVTGQQQEQKQHPSNELPSQDLDERFVSHRAPAMPLPDERTLLTLKGEKFMSRGDYAEAMACFVEWVALATEYFIRFSTKYQEEAPAIQRMIQCSIKLGCFTQAVVLYQMTNDINYGVAFVQLGQRHCNDCCDDLYECLWDVTILEYIVHLHTKRGELERKTRATQLIGQLELNENNNREILDQAINIRRGRFLRIMAKKYL